MRPGLSIPERELGWTAVRASGPGGQNVNKVASKVLLRFDLPGSTVLEPAVKARLRALAHGRLDAQGHLFIVSQVTRNQAQNLADARARLAALVARALVVPRSRRATRPTRAAKRARVADKRKTSLKKQNRSGRKLND